MSTSYVLYSLSDCISLFGGGTPTKNEPKFWNGDIPWASVKDLTNNRLKNTQESISILGLENSASKIVKAGSIIIATRMAVGRTTITDIDVAINQDLKAIECSKKLDVKYLFYFLSSKEEVFNSLASGATVKGIKINHILDMKIPLPSLTEQQKIAAILDTADSIRQNAKQQLEHYTALGQSLFLEMFGDPVTNPMGWDKKSLQSITSKIGSGSTPRGGKESYFNEGISLIRSLNIHDNNFLMKNLAFINDKQAAELSNVVVEESDVLLNITGASVCRCAIVPTKILPARVNQHVCILRCDLSYVTPYYLLHLIISNSFKRMLLNIAGTNGATREALTKIQISELRIATPPITLQNQFAERIQQIEVLKQQAQASVAQSEVLFQSLLHRAFSGELTQG